MCNNAVKMPFHHYSAACFHPEIYIKEQRAYTPVDSAPLTYRNKCALMLHTLAHVLTLSPPSTTIVPYANSLDLDETPSYSAYVSSRSKLFAYGTIVVLGGLMVKHLETEHLHR